MSSITTLKIHDNKNLNLYGLQSGDKLFFTKSTLTKITNNTDTEYTIVESSSYNNTNTNTIYYNFTNK